MLNDVLTMLESSVLMKGLLSIITWLFIAIFGPLDIIFKAFAMLVSLDLISKITKICYDNGGLIRAIKTRKFKSGLAGRRTLYKVIRYSLTLGGWNLIGWMIPDGIIIYGYPVRYMIRIISYIYIGWCELVSIGENLVGVDGGDLEPMVDGTKNIPKRLIDRIVDALLDRIEERIRGKG